MEGMINFMPYFTQSLKLDGLQLVSFAFLVCRAHFHTVSCVCVNFAVALKPNPIHNVFSGEFDGRHGLEEAMLHQQSQPQRRR